MIASTTITTAACTSPSCNAGTTYRVQPARPLSFRVLPKIVACFRHERHPSLPSRLPTCLEVGAGQWKILDGMQTDVNSGAEA